MSSGSREITEEGEYSVLIKSEEGCQNLESVMMLNTYVPIKVPNAFTPNCDGLNDVFKPVVEAELVKHYRISIYNRWGQRIFESTNPSKGWDGSNGQIGVYNWVINYSNRVGEIFSMRGVVSLIE